MKDLFEEKESGQVEGENLYIPLFTNPTGKLDYVNLVVRIALNTGLRFSELIDLRTDFLIEQGDKY